MRRLFRKNRRLRKHLTKTKERIVETIQLFNATALQQMNEKEKKKNEKMISADEEPTEDVKMKKIIKKKFSKEKENLDTMMSEIVDVKNSNAMIFMKYYINDTITISSNFTKKKNSKKNENESFEKTEEEETNE